MLFYFIYCRSYSWTKTTSSKYSFIFSLFFLILGLINGPNPQTVSIILIFSLFYFILGDRYRPNPRTVSILLVFSVFLSLFYCMRVVEGGGIIEDNGDSLVFGVFCEIRYYTIVYGKIRSFTTVYAPCTISVLLRISPYTASYTVSVTVDLGWCLIQLINVMLIYN